MNIKIKTYIKNLISYLLLGVTATPSRSDNKGIDQVFDKVTFNFGIVEGIQKNWLARIRAFRIDTNTDLSKVKKTAGDFNLGELGDAVNTEDRNKLIVKGYKDVVPDQQALCFAVDVAHTEALAQAFLEEGIPTSYIIGTTDKEVRAQRLADFAEKKYKVMVNSVIACFDEETEVLTNYGWMGIDEINTSQEVATWNNNQIVFEKSRNITIKIRLQHERIVFLETERRSLRVTENFSLMYRTLHGGKFLSAKAKELVNRSIEIPVAGFSEPSLHIPLWCPFPSVSKRKRIVSASSYNLRKLEGYEYGESILEATRRVKKRYGLNYKRPDELSESECMLIGFWLGDGSANRLVKGGIEYTLCQSKVYPEIINRIDKMLSETRIFNLRKEKKGGVGVNPYIVWSLPRGSGGGSQERNGVFHIEPYLEKEGNSLYWGLSREQLLSLLIGFWLADGNHGHALTIPKGFVIYNTNIRLLNLLQAIASCRGYRTSIRLGQNHLRNPRHSKLYSFSVTPTRSFHKMSKRVLGSVLRFEDGWRRERLWFVHTSLNHLITRRRGAVTVL